ncbi:uncharacterized protein CDAR_250391 [Caerostris darwini]|uniref:Uncharacterized protein n=1 Tax=Caerostris darwini TaxID=1538125 RepID=A0AAV4UE53_9ARAC|nr:uncharacterized protein CDAR_250391 [Caerostris darwini]
MLRKVFNLSHSLSLLLFLVAVVNASVTWRRVTKPARLIPQDLSTAIAPSTTKSAITWRRSTKSRRSTTRREEPPPIEEDDEIETADSKEQASLYEDDTHQELSIKPLVPGSRPGFWTDSSRRKKPTLLRPGSRRNSLFPTKPSPRTTPRATTERAKPVPIKPLTPPASITTATTNSGSSKLKLYGRTRPTKSPVAFRRRLKTTPPPRASSTTAATVAEELDVTIEISQEPEKKITVENEKADDYNFKSTSESVDDFSTEEVKIKPVNIIQKPALGIRRRPKNGTRLSWKKGAGRFRPTSALKPTSSSTTSTTAAPSTKTYERSKRPNFPRIRTKARTNRTTSSPKISWAREKQTTTASDEQATITFQDKILPEKVKAIPNYLRNRSKHKFGRVKTTPIPEKESEEDSSEEIIKEFTTTVAPADLESTPITEVYNTKSRTTVEPFYITRDYGQLVTAISDYHGTKEYIPTRTTTDSLRTSTDPITRTTIPATTSTEYPAQTPSSTIFDEEDFVNETIIENPEIPEYSEQPEYISLNETENDDALENVLDEEFVSITSKPLEVGEKFKYQETTTETSIPNYQITTARPAITFPTISHTITPGTNAYVVWSLGQGGSGWSYEKQGGKVKWSAQNSPAVGDRWSVQGKEEKIQFDHTLWKPTRNASRFHSERIASKKNENKATSINKNSNVDKATEMVTYIPNIPYLNEKPLKIKTTPETYTFSSLNETELSQFPSDFSNFTSSFYENIGNFSSDSNAVFYPNTDASYVQLDKKETPYFSGQNTGIKVPYIAEIRETYNNVPNFETKEKINASDVETPAILEEKFETPISYKLPEISYGVGYEYNLPKTTYAPFQTSGFVSYGTGSLNNQGGSLLETVPTNFHGAGPEVQDFSGLPPELAKAVVDAKRWTVVGNGGGEGWSLLGEDGILEWKIHNIDGKWTVTSADELVTMPLQIPDSSQVSQEDDQKQSETPNTEEKTRPKVWTLDDDYEKWRELSAEGGIQLQSPGKRPNTEYDYDETEENQEDDYYDEQEEEDYYDERANKFVPYTFNENFEDRPLWGTNQMIPNHPDGRHNNYQSYGGEIESANTKDDAIAAWKSLLVDQGTWKLSEEGKKQVEMSKPAVSSQYHYSSPDFQSETQGKGVNNNFYQTHQHENINAPGTKELAEHKKTDAETNKENSHSLQKKDRTKIEALIKKLENIQKEAKGRAVIDLSQLLKLVKTNKNSTLALSKIKKIKTSLQVLKLFWGQNIDAKDKLSKQKQQDYNGSKVSSFVQNLQNQAFSEKSVNDLKMYIQNLEKHSNNEEKVLINRNQNKFINNLKSELHNTKQPEKSNPNSNKQIEEKLHIDNQRLPDMNIEEKTIYNKAIKPSENNKYSNRPPNNQILRETENTNNNRRSDVKYDDNPPYNKEKDFKTNYEFFDKYDENFRDTSNHSPSTYLKHSTNGVAAGDRRLPGEKIEEKILYETIPKEDYRYKASPYLHNQQNYGYSDETRPNQSKSDLKYEEKKSNGEAIFDDAYRFAQENNQQYSKSKQRRKQNKLRGRSKRPIENPLIQNKFSGKRDQRPEDHDHISSTYPNTQSDREIEYSRSKFSSAERKRNQSLRRKPRPSRNYQQMKLRNRDRSPYAKFDSSEEVTFNVKDHSGIYNGYEQKRRTEEDYYESTPDVPSRKQRRPSKKRPHKHNRSPPIVLSSETEIEDEEDGSKKSRKIIVIDYAGKQKKKSPIDRKDLELIIRNVKTRRSELMEETSSERQYKDTVKGH